MAGNKKIFEQSDHIILPKATLKRFADSKTQRMSYLDLSDSENISIKKGFPRSFHTKPGYYIPAYDSVVKRYETRIGEYYKRVRNVCEHHLDTEIDECKLKSDILEIVNVQFQRTIIADDEYLRKVLEQTKEQYRQESLLRFRYGKYSKQFLEKKMLFEKGSQNLDSFRYYFQENMTGEMNQNILRTYRNFVPHILVIPERINSTFLLSPQHFVPIAECVRVVISPRIALSLYPAPLPQSDGLVKYLTKDEVDILAPRTIESALSMAKDFRQVIGEETYLNCIKGKLETYRTTIFDLPDDIVRFKGGAITLSDDQAFLELAVSIQLFRPNCHKIIIELSSVPSQYLQKGEFMDSVQMFKRWGLDLVFINDCGLDCSNIDIKSAQNQEKAITIF